MSLAYVFLNMGTAPMLVQVIYMEMRLSWRMESVSIYMIYV
ncbi:hypothetical protein CAL7102_00102 [Dulcicalothrix desertica PCC 7102]|nr:hypothetical protein CAL7102_00102 [Dulcicalothrix desertica PCC 7102]